MYSLYISSVGHTMCGVLCVHGAFSLSSLQFVIILLLRMAHTKTLLFLFINLSPGNLCHHVRAHTHIPRLFSITLQWYFCATASQFIPWFVIAHLKYGTVSIYCTLKNNHGQSTTVAIGNEKLNGKTNKRIRAWYLNRNIDAQKMPFTQNWYNWTMELNINCESSKEISAIK